MTQKYRLQALDISPNWKILRNEFYDISPTDDISEVDKFDNIYSQEDMLLLQNGNYKIDLGWYGGTELINNETGYCVHLFKGENWNKSVFLEKFRSQDKKEVINKINEIINLVDLGAYENVLGYLIDEDDLTNKNDLSKIENYSSLNNKNNC